MRIVGLNLEVRDIAVEESNYTLMPDWRVGREDTVPRRRLPVLLVGDLGLLEDLQVHIGMFHSPQ